MQAYAYCGCYYNDPANLTSCANAELQSKASPSATFSPINDLPTPVPVSSTAPLVAPISIYPVVTASRLTNVQPPSTTPGPPLPVGTRALVSTISTTSVVTISGPVVSFSTYTTTYITTLYYCNDIPCPTTTSTFSTTITTTIAAPGIAAPSQLELGGPDIESILTTRDITYTTTTTGSDSIIIGTGRMQSVKTVYIDPAPTMSAHMAVNPAVANPASPDTVPVPVPELATEAGTSPAETGGAGNGGGGESGVCVGRLRKRTRVLIVGG